MQPDKIRLVTFAILGMLVLRTITNAARLRREAKADEERESAPAQSATEKRQ